MTDAKVDEIKARLAALQQEEYALCDELAAAQKAEWDASLDNLNVQLHLGVMDLRERVDPVLGQLRDRIHALRSELNDGERTTFEDVCDALRHGFAAAIDDLTAAAHDARDAIDARHQ
jgi:uncharacterized small protein (DUF1192 family)